MYGRDPKWCKHLHSSPWNLRGCVLGDFKVKKHQWVEEMDDWEGWDMPALECDLSMGRGDNRAHLYLCKLSSENSWVSSVMTYVFVFSFCTVCVFGMLNHRLKSRGVSFVEVESHTTFCFFSGFGETTRAIDPRVINHTLLLLSHNVTTCIRSVL